MTNKINSNNNYKINKDNSSQNKGIFMRFKEKDSK